MKKTLIVLFACFALLAKSAYGQDEDTTKKTTVVWKSKSIQLGNIPQGVPARVEYEFTNTGKFPLEIYDVKSSCSCTISSYPKKPVPPGQSDKVVATYNASVLGDFHKTMLVYYTGTDEVVLLVLDGVVVAAPEQQKQ